MLSLLLALFVTFKAIKYYQKAKYGEMLFCFSVISLDFFGFGKLLGDSPIKITDILLLGICYIWIKAWSKNRKFFNIKGNSFARTFLFLFLWITIVFLGTIVLGQDSAVYALKVYRVFLIIPFFFVLRKMSVSAYTRYLSLMLKFSILQGIFYYLQFIGITGILSGYGADAVSTNGENSRLGNYPMLADIFLLYFIFKDNISVKKKVFFIFFFGMMPILGQMRGQTICLAIAICIFFFFKKKNNKRVLLFKKTDKKLIPFFNKRNIKLAFFILAGMIVYSTIVESMFKKRQKESDLSITQEIEMSLEDPMNMYQNFSWGDSGTFMFRIAMLGERISFMVENPKYALTGVGCVHELSPKNTYEMIIGTIMPEDLQYQCNRSYVWLSSADIEWVGILMRYGLIGVIIWISFYINIIKCSFKRIRYSRNTLFLVYACYSLPMFIGSFNGNGFDSYFGLIKYISIGAFMCAYVREEKNRTQNIKRIV